MLTGFGYLGATARAGQSTPPGDTTPPVLSGASVTPGTTTASLDISTDEGNGTLYWMVSTNASETAAAVKAGGGLDSGSQAVSSPGAQPTIDAGGLTADTSYHFHAMHEDAANNQSAVSSTSFTTNSALEWFNSTIGGAPIAEGVIG